jgi:amino acid permease
LSIALILIDVLAIHANFIGFSSTLAKAHACQRPWIGVLFVINLYFLWRKSLNATVAAALIVGTINIGVIVALSLLTLPHVQKEYLTYVDLPMLDGRPFDAGLFQLVFGVILVAYFGHTSMGNCAKVVLRRDPGGRSLLWGSLAAMASAVIVYCLWLLTVNGTISPAEMAGQTGTALIPLAQQVGPAVNYLGAVFVILGLGMGSIHFSLGLYNLIQEWLPRDHPGRRSERYLEADKR